MTKERIEHLVKEQFALDYNCRPEDFDQTESLVTVHKSRAGARRFTNEDSLLSILSYKGKLVITAEEAIVPWCEEVLKKKLSAQWCFDADGLWLIEEKLREFGYGIKQSHIYFLPNEIHENAKIPLRWYKQQEIPPLESDQRITEAFLYHGAIQDMLGVAAVSEKSEILAIAGASNNGEHMWEIGVDSFSEGKGLGQAVVGNLAAEVLRRGKVPFYGTAISHLASQRVALGSGMMPAFTELRSTPKIK